MGKMTLKQQAFCDYYIETGNATEAAKKAGYKGRNLNRVASENLTKLDIRNYIDERMAEKEGQRIASQDEVLQFFTSVMRGEVIERVPVVLKNRYEMVNKEPSISDRLRAGEDIAKRYGMFREGLDVTNNSLIRIVDDVPDE